MPLLGRRRSAGTRKGVDEDYLGDGFDGIRHIRLWAGLAMIALAVLFIVVDQVLGLGQQSSTPGGQSLGPNLPTMATPLVQRGIHVEPRFVGRQSHVGGSDAGSGKQFLEVAVKIVNGGTTALAYAADDFRVLDDTEPVGTGRPYPGQESAFGGRRLASGSTVKSILVFPVPAKLASPVLEYVPQDSPGTPLLWRLP